MRIILVHGLGRTCLSLVLLVRRLSLPGHTSELFAYSGLTEPHESILARLVSRLRCLAAQRHEVGLIGHSFGGLLLREAVAVVPELRVKHLIMLSTPNRRPRLAVRLYTRFPMRIIRGSCGQCLADPLWFHRLPPVLVPYTIVAGTGGWRGRLSPFNGEVNDGIVAVSETILCDDDQPFLLPAIHSFIMNSHSVHELIAQKLGAS